MTISTKRYKDVKPSTPSNEIRSMYLRFLNKGIYTYPKQCLGLVRHPNFPVDLMQRASIETLAISENPTLHKIMRQDPVWARENINPVVLEKARLLMQQLDMFGAKPKKTPEPEAKIELPTSKHQAEEPKAAEKVERVKLQKKRGPKPQAIAQSWPPSEDAAEPKAPTLHAKGSLTSMKAAEKVAKIAPSQRQVIYLAIKEAGAHGMTDHELVEKTGIKLQTVNPRRFELARRGDIKKSGATRKSPSNCDCDVWVTMDTTTDSK